MHRDRRSGNGRNIGMIVGGCNLDDIGADDIDLVKLAQHRQNFRR